MKDLSRKYDQILVRKVQILLEEKGRKTLELARQLLLEEQKRIECKEVREALNYFMNEYWHDVSRPALLSLICETVGGDSSLITPLAVSLILVSGGIDIHDDIIDSSRIKYGQLTLYGKFGKDIALLAGNALLFKGLIFLQEFKDVSERQRNIVLNTIKNTFFEIGDAEAMELQFRKCVIFPPKEYLKIIEKKAADVEAHVHIAAVLGGAREEEIGILRRYGRLLGMLIIIRDDVLDVLDVTELKSRIVKEHLPLPILYACQNAEVKSEFEKIFKKKKITKKEVKLIQEITEKSGGIQASIKLMEKLAGDALSLLKYLKANRDNLEMLIRFTLTFNGSSNIR